MAHARRDHCHYGTSGHVWQGQFKAFIIRDDHLLRKNVTAFVTFSFGAQDLLQSFGPTKCRIQDERENPT
jgi:hypothetical protein